MRLFDRLTGAELLRYVGLLRRVPADEIAIPVDRAAPGARAGRRRQHAGCGVLRRHDQEDRLACALIHAPRLVILDEPFESVDPVSGEHIRAILRGYVASGGTVVLSSHVMELVESLCDELAVVAQGRVLAAGTLDQVRGDGSLQRRFLELVATRRQERRRWRGCDPRPAQAEPAPERPAAQRLADRRADHRSRLRPRDRGDGPGRVGRAAVDLGGPDRRRDRAGVRDPDRGLAAAVPAGVRHRRDPRPVPVRPPAGAGPRDHARAAGLRADRAAPASPRSWSRWGCSPAGREGWVRCSPPW